MAVRMLPPTADSAQPSLRCAEMSPVVHAEATHIVVTLRGEADVSTRPALADVLSRVIAHGAGDVAIDLAPVTFIDTATVRALATGQLLLDRRGRALTIRSPSRLAVRVLELFGLADLIETRPVPQP
jgi:anti-anti-sigma factor